MSAIRIDSERIVSAGAEVAITHRAKTVLIEAYHWAGHQCSAYEGAIQSVRIVRPTLAEAVAELKRRWTAQAGESSYVGFGGQFRNEPHLSLTEIESVMDSIQEACEEAGLVTV